MKHYMPTRILTGFGILQKQKAVFGKLGKRCLIITSKHSGKASGALDDLTAILNESSIAYDVFDRIAQNPTVVSCIEAGRCAHSFDADFIVGIGGGSVMDASKTAAVVAANPQLEEADIYAQNWKNSPVPLVLIGTTAGTGSEVTYVSVMTNQNGIKKSIHNDDLYARYAFGDPAYTRSMPEKVRISTAIDALAHLLEAYFNNNAELLVMPGETRTLKWVPNRVGIIPFYCTDFCSALHQEMQGYVRVSPAGSNAPLKFTIDDKLPKDFKISKPTTQAGAAKTGHNRK